MQIKAVVVDVGGVLEHTPATGWVERWEARLGLPPGGLRDLVSPLWAPGRIGRSDLADIEQRTSEVLGLDDVQSTELWDDVWTEYLGVLNEELVTCLASLRPRFKTAILSNSFVGAREREQARYGFEVLFDAVVYSHEEGLEKPDPAFYALVCARLDVVPSQVVFLDDLPENVDAARELGMSSILFTSNEQAIRDLERHLGSMS